MTIRQPQIASKLPLGLLLAAALVLAGCPKNPQVAQSESGAIGATVQPAPGTTGSPSGSATGKPANEPERVPPRPEVVALPGSALGAPAGAAPTATMPGPGQQATAPGARHASPAPKAALSAPSTTPGGASSLGASGATPLGGSGFPTAQAPGAPAGVAGTPLARTESPLKDVFFDTDRSFIRPDAKVALNEDVKWLNANAKAAIVIQGHCDERGTEEYNLALGQRRAQAVRDYLVAAGIDTQRLATISYGKDRPFVVGHDEEAWKWDRRAHLAPK